MSRYAHTDTPGQVILQPARPGRRNNFGALATLNGGRMMVCIGYTSDGSMAAYIPMTQIETLKGAYRTAASKPMYKLLKKLIQRYEAVD